MVVFDEASDLETKIAYYCLRHDDGRREIAALARARVLPEHTYGHRVRELISAVGLG